jgi:hypothetical protein
MHTSWLLHRYLSDTDSNYVCVNVPLRLYLKGFKFKFNSDLVGDRIIASMATLDNKIIGDICLRSESYSKPRLPCSDVSGHRVTSVFGCRSFVVTFDQKKIAKLLMEKCTWLLSHALVTSVLDAGGWLSFHALPILSLGEPAAFLHWIWNIVGHTQQV